MIPQFTDEQVHQALQNCADEPVHIPGVIQPFGWLLAYSVESQYVLYASDNAENALRKPLHQILGSHVRDLLGREVWHDLQNFVATRTTADQRIVIGSWNATDEGPSYLVAAWQSGDCIVVEFEEHSVEPLLSARDLQIQTSLINQVQNTQDVQSLLELATKQLRYLTGFDRVMIYRFDQDWNGEVVAETCSNTVEPFLGLNFPSFDIPAQARAIMERIPLRVIADRDQTVVPVSAAHTDLPPLDLTLGETRGTSPVHLQYLQNMGSRATMTLSVVIEGSLWGIISFHHRRPRLLPAQLRTVLKSFLGVFSLKLGLLNERRFRTLSDGVEQFQQEFHTLISSDPSLNELVEVLGTRLAETFEACGLYIQSDQGEYTYGDAPSARAVAKVVSALPEGKASPYFTDRLADLAPEFGDEDFASIAGVAAVFNANDWMMLIFRRAITQTVSWAGDPEKTIEFVDGNARLSPRGSFSSYLAETQGRSKSWSTEDQILAQKLWPLLSAALNSDQKQRYMRDLNRQQELMIDELNHRVRNILALVQSVSTEAKKSQSSLESYSKAIESRIRALAAAHAIGSGSSAKQVDISEIILQEAKPYEDSGVVRVHVSGAKMAMAPEFAPIFALVIHELMTNAAKYGALSSADGTVTITMEMIGEDLNISWQEAGGPPVSMPNRQGFGTTLIKRAVPYELGGSSSLEFKPGGVEASILLPANILSVSRAGTTSNEGMPNFQAEDLSGPVIPSHLKDGIVLVVEDNFMIAEGLVQQLKDFGFEKVETASNLETALEFLGHQTPDFAILDVNLGHGTSSLQIAEVLLDRHVPLVFATGYGEMSSMSPRLSKQIVLTKPIDARELAHAIARASAP